MISEILVENSRGVFGGQVRVPVFQNLGLYLVGSFIICVRLRASILDCRMARVLTSLGWGRYFDVRMKSMPKVNCLLLRPRS